MFTILGTPPSKSNCYKIITLRKGGKTHGSLAKTAQIKNYETMFRFQLPKELKDKMIDSPFGLKIHVYFANRAHDLDNAFKIFLDCLQANRVITNDNRCYEIHAKKFIDKKNPRVEFELFPLIEEKSSLTLF